MRIGIHQPQYLPWIHYFEKIQKCDIFILLDNVNYQKNGLQNRNQIKGINGKKWLTVPVEHKLGQKINHTKVVNNTNWKKKHLLTLDQFYNNSNYYKYYRSDLIEIYEKDWIFLNDINCNFISKIMNWLNITTPIYKSSNLNLEGSSTDLIIKICKEFNADHYISGLGAKNYLNEDKFREHDIELIYLENKTVKAYKQLYSESGFFNDLSSLDIIFNCGNEWKNFLI